MQNGQPYKNFTVQDFERYHNGTMPAQEMHALEKAALEDPFLADALEGYAMSKEPVFEVQAIRQQLQQRTHKKAVLVPFQKRRYSFLKVAAMVIILAGISFFIYQNIGLRNNTVAVNKEETTSAADSITVTSAPASNSTAPVEKPQTLPRENSIKSTTKKRTYSPTPVEQADVAVVPQQRNEVVHEVTDSITFLKPHAPVVKNEESAQRKASTANNTINGRIVDANNNAVPYANVRLQNKNAVAADANGNFSVSVPDTTAHVAVDAVGYTKNNAILERDKKNEIVMQESNESLNEVVVIGYGTNKRERRKNPQAVIEKAEPVNGWAAFDDYVAEHLQPDDEAEFKKIKGVVKLSFEVNDKGEAVNVKVEQSLCATCDAAAVEIVTKGTRWKKKGKNGNKAKASIRF